MIWLLFLPLLLLAAALLFMAGRQVFLHVWSLSWVPTQGVLLARGVEQQRQPGSDSAAIGASSRLAGTFSYQWEDKTYTSDQVSFSLAKSRQLGGHGDWDDRLDRALGEVGGSVDIWVNPSRPAQAVVVRDIRWSDVGWSIGFGLFIGWISIAVLFGGPPTTAAVATFSWRAVGRLWLIAAPLSVLIPLLWRDGHPVWAAICSIPLLLALYATGYGWTRT